MVKDDVRMIDQARAAAALGAQKLDEVRPGWEREIVLSRLRMSEGHSSADRQGRPRCGCIGAQLDLRLERERERALGEKGLHRGWTADWRRGLRRLGIRAEVSLGFAAPSGLRLAAHKTFYRFLTMAWGEEILKRRRGS